MKKYWLWILGLSFAIILGGVGWQWFNWGARGIQNLAVARREIALRVLAEHLSGAYAGKTAVIISNPFSKLPGQPDYVYNYEEAGIRGLKRGWNDKVQLAGVAFPELRPGAAESPEQFPMDPETKTPLSFLTSLGAWDAIYRQYPAADLFVSLIGLPIDLKDLEFWRASKPQLALLLPDVRMLGSHESLRDQLLSGKLAALILNRPGAPPESTPLDADYRKEFDQHYLLVTGQNYQKLLTEWPHLL